MFESAVPSLDPPRPVRIAPVSALQGCVCVAVVQVCMCMWLFCCCASASLFGANAMLIAQVRTAGFHSVAGNHFETATAKTERIGAVVGCVVCLLGVVWCGVGWGGGVLLFIEHCTDRCFLSNRLSPVIVSYHDVNEHTLIQRANLTPPRNYAHNTHT